MKMWMKVIVGAFAIIGALYTAMMLYVFSDGFKGSSCITYPVMKVPSPSGSSQVRVENSACNASGELETTVYVFDAAGQTGTVALIADATQKTDGYYAPLSLRINWASDTQLQISYPSGTKIKQKLNPDASERVAVMFSELPGGGY